MKKLLLIIMMFVVPTVHAYQIGNSYATLVGCNYAYNSDYGTSGYTGTYRTQNGNMYRIYFGASYCAY